MSLNDDIAQLSSHFSERIEEVEKIESRLFQKILFMGIIDALSRAGFPDVSGNRRRVITLIDRCSKWLDKDRVSAQQLVLMLEDEGKVAGDLYHLANQTVNSWSDGDIIRPTSDLELDRVRSCATESELRAVEEATYKQLFYTYRNCLIHEFREPGYGIESSEDPSTPYYIGMLDDPWQLVFTTEFIRRVCVDCLGGLVKSLCDQQQNPYDSYEFDSLWRSKNVERAKV